MKTEKQLYRLGIEKQLVAEELPQFEFFDIEGDTYIEGWVSIYGSSSEFKLRLVLGNFPDDLAKLFVVSPAILPKYNSRGNVNSEGASHAFHTLKNGPGGIVQICHFKRDWWDSSKTTVAILMKAIYWLECYCAYLKTGKSLSEYCL
jgi:hypothetical protein